MTTRARSINGVPIRLSDERWRHVVEHHDDLAGHLHDVLETIASPEAVYEGDAGELLAASTLVDYRILHVASASDREETSGMEAGAVLDLLESLPHLLKLPSKQMWFDFDEEADVLYVSFERPQGATDSELDENGILTRYRGDQLVGVTILNARKRFGSPA